MSIKICEVKFVCAKLEAELAKFPVIFLVCAHSTPFSIWCQTISLQAGYVTFEFVWCFPQWELRFSVGVTQTAAHES